MTGDNFELYLEHFIKFTRCSTENRVLIVLDNHESHITPKGLQICNDNGIALVTLPSHTSHRLQPLDRTVFKTFKAYYNVASDDFMHANPGIPINIYQIPGLVAKSFGKAFTPENIQKGFACTGIWPHELTNILRKSMGPNTHLGTYSMWFWPFLILASTSSSNISVASKQLRHFPKAGPRKGRGGRRPLNSRIITSTLVKTALEIEHALRLKKKRKTSSQMKPVTNFKRKCFMISDDKPTELDKSSVCTSDYSEIDSNSDKLLDTYEEEHSIKAYKFRSRRIFTGKAFFKENRKSKCLVFPDKDDTADVVIYDMLKFPNQLNLVELKEWHQNWNLNSSFQRMIFVKTLPMSHALLISS
ncbi:hypothetical protein PR048_010969 [Dryococelus australis]|uniref:DDE-1 domain-containing protein n=1 Tax=Dryococelus australis TaxID=614101 RepID=A0ABQ9HK94_9NEOP|nr:hypothetical protein PR048_010969 [Dryococelus australis]